MQLAAVQLAPRFLDREGTIATVVDAIGSAASDGASLVAFPETFVPGYPVWADYTHASYFDHPDQKATWARYLRASVDVSSGDLDPVVAEARRGGIFAYVGIAERSESGGSVYCSLVGIHPEDGIVSVHRKLKPTYGERMMWADGDGAGLVAHRWAGTVVSGLNCWENWMPLARASLYAQGTRVHCAAWPGSPGTSHDVSRFIAREGRIFVVSSGAVLRAEHVPDDLEVRESLLAVGDTYSTGGAIIVGPDGEPVAVAEPGVETILHAEIDLARVDEERHNFDPAGHYSRPDVLDLRVDRRRRRGASFIDD